MTNPEEAIDRVLSGLRAVETPQGMERRILEAAQTRAFERRGRNLATLAGARSWTLAAAALVMIALAASIALHRKYQVRHEMAGVTTHPSPEAPVPVRHRDEEARTNLTRHEKVFLPRQSQAKPEVLSEEEALALSEMLAPSKPAPPLPLTHQEKMLANAVHQAGPEELSSLRSEIRARQMELSKAEFRNFFEPLPAKDNE